jgi:GxxExxY protein
MDVLALHTDVTDSILRCAIAVHRGLGPGLPEHSYQTSLALEFDANSIRYVDNLQRHDNDHGIKRYQL